MFVEQEIAGAELVELGRSGTADQLKECGLKSVGQQLKLRRLVRSFGLVQSGQTTADEESFPALDKGGAIPAPGKGGAIRSNFRSDNSDVMTDHEDANRAKTHKDRKPTLAELNQFSHGIRNTYIAK